MTTLEEAGGESSRRSVILVVPCYDEAERLRLDAFRRFLATDRGHRLLFVDDGSRDDTLALLRELEAEAGERVDVLALERNRGKAEAVRRGMMQALAGGADWVGYWDADLATPLDEVDRMLSVVEESPGVEIVLGSRVKLLGKAIDRRVWRHYIGRVFATAASAVLDLPVYDTQCGAKLLRATGRAVRLFEHPFETRWIFDVELLARFLYREGGRREALWEHPVSEWRDVAGSKVRPWHAVRAAADLARLFVRYRLRRSRPE